MSSFGIRKCPDSNISRRTVNDLDINCRYELLRRICIVLVVQIEPRNHVHGREDYPALTPQHELDTDRPVISALKYLDDAVGSTICPRCGIFFLVFIVPIPILNWCLSRAIPQIRVKKSVTEIL